MGFLDFFKHADINQGVKDYQAAPGGILLDVRTPQEYREGSIPGSQNLPLQNLNRVQVVVKDKATPVFVYCHSGARSRQAASILQRMGYLNVRDIGGIMSYSGPLQH